MAENSKRIKNASEAFHCQYKAEFYAAHPSLCIWLYAQQVTSKYICEKAVLEKPALWLFD